MIKIIIPKDPLGPLRNLLVRLIESLCRRALSFCSVLLSYLTNPSFGILIVLLMLLSLIAYLGFMSPKKFVFSYSLFTPVILLLFFLRKSRQLYAWERLGLAAIALAPIAIWTFTTMDEKIIMYLQWVLAASLVSIAKYFFIRMDEQIIRSRVMMSETAKDLKSFVQENTFYTARITELKKQLASRKNLSVVAKEMGTLLDPEKITQLLQDKARMLFPNEQIWLKSIVPTDDPIDCLVIERRMPILIKDFLTDTRFAGIQNSIQDPAYLPDAGYAGPEIRSSIAMPLFVEKHMMGLIRVDSQMPKRFIENDLEQLELLAHLSALALENANLFTRVKAMATKDSLTGLATHRIFQERMVEEILRAARYHTPLSLLMVDIDHFKQVNDRYGHLVGDHVLKELGQIILALCREVDFAARYGGEEFTVIIPGVEHKETYQFAENLRRKIVQQQMVTPNQTLNVSASIGCAFFPQDAQIASQLIRVADERLYRAKAQGRNRVVIS